MKKLFGSKLSIAISVLLCVCLLCAVVLVNTVHASESYAVNSNLNKLMIEVDDSLRQRSDKAYSSNPYDYIEDNASYESIVNRGIPALPVITDMLHSAAESGLREYILVIAAEEIAKIHLNSDEVYRWSSAKEWICEWDIFLRNLPVRVERIISDESASVKEKEGAIQEFGVMCLPYLKNAITDGHSELQAVYDDLANFSVANNAEAKSITDDDLLTIKSMIDKVTVD